MKYGVAPLPNTAAAAATSAVAPATPKATAAAAQPASAVTSTTAPATNSASNDLSDEMSETASEPVIDRRPIRYLKGKLISVDCSHPPLAVVTFSSGAKTLKLKAPDYKSMALIGADTFSCAWANRQVDVNYKAVGADGGDLVSLEVH